MAGTSVVLHRIGRQTQGPIDSSLTDARGRFAFRFRLDTAAVYLLSARFAGIEYFSPPVHTDPALPDTQLVVIVSDTSSSAPVGTDARHVVVSRPAKDGSRPVLEIVIVGNSGNTTRVAQGADVPTWAEPLPPGALKVVPGNGDFSPDAFVSHGDSAQLYAPIAPGEKQIIFSYSLPPDLTNFRLPLGDSIPQLNILLEESGATIAGGAVAAADTQTIEGRHFRRWTGSVNQSDRVEIDFGRDFSKWYLPGLLGVLGLAFLTTTTLLVRRRRAGAGLPPNVLVEAIARLDAEYAGRQAQTTAEEWTHYQSRRAQLKARLETHLAGRGTPQ